MRKGNLRKQVTAITMAAAMLLSSMQGMGTVFAAEEPQVQEIVIGTEQRGTILSEEQVDSYVLTADSTDSFYSLSFTNINADIIYYTLYADAEKTQVVREATREIGMAQTETWNLAKLIPGHTYYLDVKADISERGEYKYTFTKVDDDVKDETSEATSVTVREEVRAEIQNKMDVDCFTFTTDQTDSFYSLSFTNINADIIYYTLYADAEKTQVVREATREIGKAETETWNLAKLIPGHTYYLDVKADINEKGEYKYTFTKVDDDVKDEVENSTKLAMNKEKKQYGLQNERDVDFYQFTTTDYENYTLDFSNLANDGYMYISVYDNADCLENGLVFQYECNKKQSIPTANKKLKLNRFHTYYVKVTGDKAGKYKVGVGATAPSGATIKNTTKKNATKKTAKISWKKVSRATGYEVYRKTGKNGTYKKIKTISKASTVSYTDSKSLKKGKTYFYKVRAYKKMSGKVYYSAFSTEKSIKIK